MSINLNKKKVWRTFSSRIVVSDLFLLSCMRRISHHELAVRIIKRLNLTNCVALICWQGTLIITADVWKTWQKLSLPTAKQKPDSLPITLGLHRHGIPPLTGTEAPWLSRNRNTANTSEGYIQNRRERLIFNSSAPATQENEIFVIKPGAGNTLHAALEPTRKWQPEQEIAATSGTHQTGSSCFGWLMSVDYCHWMGCCIQQGTAAYPIGLLRLNGEANA